MKKLLTAGFTAIFAAALLTGCGNTGSVNYDFSDTELSHALGMSKKDADKLPYKSEAMATDSFLFFNVPHGGALADSDGITMLAENGRVYSIVLGVVSTGGDALSEHTVCGIKVGESSADAFEAAKSYFGKEGTAVNVPDGLGLSFADSYAFGDPDSDKGELLVTVNNSTGKVFGLNLTRE